MKSSLKIAIFIVADMIRIEREAKIRDTVLRKGTIGFGKNNALTSEDYRRPVGVARDGVAIFNKSFGHRAKQVPFRSTSLVASRIRVAASSRFHAIALMSRAPQCRNSFYL